MQADSQKVALYDHMILINKTIDIIFDKTELSDHQMKFIPVASYLLHNQFPAIKGFGLSLLQERSLTAKLPNEILQIIHNYRTHHWLLTNTINCYRGEVKIFLT